MILANPVYWVVQGKCPIWFFIPKLCFTIFYHIFQVVLTASLGDSFDTSVDPTGCYAMQQWMKIIEAYFATKSVLLTQWQCRRDFGRNNIPDRKTIQHLVTKFQETGSVTDAHKGHSGQHRLSIIPENTQNLWERLEESPRKSTHLLSQETGISRASILRILHDDKLFPDKIQIFQRLTDHNKVEVELF